MISSRKLCPAAVFTLVLTVCTVDARAQSFPVIVAGGPTIYKLQGGTSTVVATVTGANFESVAVGPDNADLDQFGNAMFGFLILACDVANKAIYRLDSGGATIQLIYSQPAGALVPECGRFSSAGDFLVTDKAGAGIFQIGSQIANVSLFNNGPFPAQATQLNASAPSSGRGITQKKVGDVLAVDNAKNQVVRFPFGSLATSALFASTNLDAPVGIARISNGDVFVSNSVTGQNSVTAVTHFTSSGALAPKGACSGLTLKGNQTPAYLATVLTGNPPANTLVTDTIFLITSSNTSATLWSWNTASAPSCSLTSVATVKTPLSGLAIAPAGAGKSPLAPPAVELDLPVNSGDTFSDAALFDFHSNQFRLIAKGCTAQVTAYPLSPATIERMIQDAGTGNNPGQFQNPASPSVNQGEDGYQIAYVGHWVTQGCAPIAGASDFITYLASFIDANQFTNPRIVQCDNSDSGTEPILDATSKCVSEQMIAVYGSGPIPGDPVPGGTTRGTNSIFAGANENTQGQQAIFCGFQSPVKNPGEVGYPSVFKSKSTNTIPLKFKLAQAGGSCQNGGPFVSTASALLSVLQISDSNGNAVFNPINPNPTSSSIDAAPLFNPGNNEYSFTLTIKNLVGGPLASGTYTLTVTFLTDDAITTMPVQFIIQ